MRSRQWQARVTILLLLYHGFVVTGGQALHALAPCGECLATRHEHSRLSAHDRHCSCNQRSQQEVPAHSNSTSDPGEPAHDASHCAICQWCAQGQLVMPAPEVLEVEVLVVQQSREPASVAVAPIELPPAVRGPPTEFLAVL